MKKKIYVLAALLSVSIGDGSAWPAAERREQGNIITEDIPDIPQRIVDRMLQYQNTRSASIQDWDASGKGMLVSTRFAETSQLHYVEKPAAMRRQITFFSEPVGEARICPDLNQRAFLFTKDVGGSEFYQIFHFDLDGAEYKMLTDGSSRNGAMLWSNRGDKFVYYSTKRNGRDWDLFLSTLKEPNHPKPILQQGGTWTPEDWSPDDRLLLVSIYVSINESYLYVLDVESGSLEQINPTDKKISYGAARSAHNAKGIFLTSDEDSEFRRLKYYDLKKKTFTDLTADIQWDVEEIAVSKLRDKLAFTTNEDGISRLYILDTRTNKYKQVPGVPLGEVYSLKFHPHGGRLAIVVNTPQTPGDVYVLNLKNNSLVRWTYSEVGGLDTESFVVPDLIHYQTFDQVHGKPRMIPAFYYKPKNAKPPFPVLVYIHGGPESQHVPYFSSARQYYVNELGIAVIAPNVRGSAGYGKTYLQLDNGYKREDSIKDIGKLLDWIKKQPDLDSSRVAVMGASYGGYMVLASMVHYNDRLKCGIDVVGISNFVTFLENTKDYRRDLRRAEYGDERDPQIREFLLKISPTTNAGKITKPMFIAQGLNDPRVPVTESQQIVSAVRKNSGAVWYMLAKDEGHGFRKKTNRDYYNNAAALFLEEHLLK